MQYIQWTELPYFCGILGEQYGLCKHDYEVIYGTVGPCGGSLAADGRVREQPLPGTVPQAGGAAARGEGVVREGMGQALRHLDAFLGRREVDVLPDCRRYRAGARRDQSPPVRDRAVLRQGRQAGQLRLLGRLLTASRRRSSSGSRRGRVRCRKRTAGGPAGGKTRLPS